MVILITGASSGIGNEAARMLAAQRHKVYAAARRTELLEPLKADGIVPVRLDVTDEDSCRSCIKTIADAEVTMADARKQVETNLLGMAYLCSLVIPYMRAQRSGRIVNISSIAGLMPVLYGGWYNISKYGVEALSDNLRMELKPFGIKVIKIEPGGIKTPWGSIAADHLEECTEGTVYADAARNEGEFMRKHYSGNLLSRPIVVARVISRAVNARRPRLYYRPGLGSTFLIVSHALLPGRLWDSLASVMSKAR